ncbi:hypothetical protein AGRA3207_003766 [Actinomadura graeca]|uniref:Integral membrane protein n=1 Tax=Actinomadura graeca TaxID=2750812 RepID=A0ABX8QVB6_9ACTN|nr:hypothetical protein [Actinomadura graeca]QXJ22715.1 hypothetical protein AGRA3207_003766 [Actinomadura graeca]
MATARPPKDGRRTQDDPAGAGVPVSLRKTPAPVAGPGTPGTGRAEPSGPAWLVVPVRVVALVVVVPLRLGYDLIRLAGRGVAAVLRGLLLIPAGIGRILARAWNAFYGGVLAPLGRLAAAVARGLGAGVAWLFDVLVVRLLVRPLRWLAVVLSLGLLRLLGRGTGRLARWFHRVLLSPAGRFLARLGRAIAVGTGWVLAVFVVLPAVILWRYVLRPPLLGLAWVFRVVGQGIAWAARGIGAGLAWAGRGLLWVGRGFVWVGRGLGWVGRGVGRLLASVGSVVADGWNTFWSAVAWSWRLLGRGLAWLGRVLFVPPARFVYRYVLAPLGRAAAGTWRLAARVLRRLWWTLAVSPARWVGTSVLRPAGRGVRAAWRVSVGDPIRMVRRTVRETGREVRLTLRRTFLGR